MASGVTKQNLKALIVANIKDISDYLGKIETILESRDAHTFTRDKAVKLLEELEKIRLDILAAESLTQTIQTQEEVPRKWYCIYDIIHYYYFQNLTQTNS